ncbi:hypothetical protein FB45DRAFT_1065090 [Roridomyces roridus]|uniref:Uncharacterized protein n=1 Tax=Roridomyces roridus TaxID=1738132 RepID=A0AAD7FE97_9AGAR|nr:hypothetical protein FB45DRAFT_1065090 [Roridomyces roridus]
MQCKFLVAAIVSCFALAVSAAPIAAPNPDSVNVFARAPAPAPVPEPETAEARACRLYACL